ncbi:MAG: TonB-dependent receptor [Brachymonas sp.]|nr:TonB-dependent receptor [Brachymonas sp.]
MKTPFPYLALAAAVASALPAVALGQTAAQQKTAMTSPAAPQADAATLPVVVTANRVEQPLTDVLADFTLIDREQIAQSGAVNVVDLLARQPGMELVRNGGPGTSSSIYIRGADTRFTAVYVDGVRVDSQSTGGAPWEAIALGQVDRIEIVRGPAAAVYGSDAVAGVVQIFTKKGEGAFSPYVAVGAGNRRTGKVEAGFSGKSGAVDYSLGVERATSRGFNAREDGNPDRDGYRQNAAHARLGWQINPAHRLDVTGSHSKMDAQYDAGRHTRRRPATTDDHAINRLTTWGATWSAQWLPAFSTRLSVNESRQRYETTPSPYLTNTKLRNYLLQNAWKQGGHTFTAALERREDELINTSVPQGRKDRYQNAVALGYGYSGGPHTLQVNLRADRDSEFGKQTTGGAAYGFAFAPGWRVTAAAGTAFRVPTLYQRFSEYGQASLQPEKSRNAELGLHWQNQGNRFGITAYHNRISNLISFGAAGPCASPWGCYNNTGRAVLRGVTVSGAYQVGRVNLHGSVDWQKPCNADTDKLLARRAERLLKLGADTRLSTGAVDWTLGAELQASGRRYNDAANTQVLGGYGLVNLYANAVIARDWQLLARVDNVGDKKYQLAKGYGTPGRTFYVNLRWAPRR